MAAPRESCAQTSDCDDDLVCVQTEPLRRTCQIPCTDFGACPDIYMACLQCAFYATPPYCENVGCE